jgi:hypothetical protein
MGKLALLFLLGLLLWLTSPADAHLVRLPDPPRESVLQNRLKQQRENLYHSRYVCRYGGAENRRWHCAATLWIGREYRETKARLEPKQAWWVSKQIAIAEKIGQGGDAGGTDPWPNCPDPYDHAGYSWSDTLSCESPTLYARYGPNDPRAWLDPVGFYRCGLQFDPSWERKYGRLCP